MPLRRCFERWNLVNGAGVWSELTGDEEEAMKEAPKKKTSPPAGVAALNFWRKRRESDEAAPTKGGPVDGR